MDHEWNRFSMNFYQFNLFCKFTQFVTTICFSLVKTHHVKLFNVYAITFVLAESSYNPKS